MCLPDPLLALLGLSRLMLLVICQSVIRLAVLVFDRNA